MDILHQPLSGKTRHEHDLLGDREVPVEYYFGVQTLRGVENFKTSGIKINHYPEMINALAMVKEAAAIANCELGYMDTKKKDAIVKACREIYKEGKLYDHFVVDVIQGGAGTSTNMNANEVIANRALEILGYQRGEYQYCHPNNDVNLAQSTNDAYPTGMKLAIVIANKRLVEVLKTLVDAFRKKAKEFEHVVKMGRTHLQDAVPMTLGQEFEGYAVALDEAVGTLEETVKNFYANNMGATAVGTGINSDPDYPPLVSKYLSEITGLPMVPAKNLVQATNDTTGFVLYSSVLKYLAVKLSKTCNDLRVLTSGPRTGIGEINLPPMQPGSSIMPGKVNPVIAEVVSQIAFRVIGNDHAATMGSEAGQLELNVMEPVIVASIFDSITVLKNGMEILRDKCIAGITANEERCKDLVLHSIGLVTALNPYIGYEASTAIAKEAMETGRGVYELVLEKKLLSQEQLDDILAPENMIKPRKMK
ncbi:MAG: aspartate ammonia-lyase [Prevotellaceae bacterium]|jgi:aspartate ammonia-lyase|nr:aspartate ammonia-lyase [Prevotellaceae bacterium]